MRRYRKSKFNKFLTIIALSLTFFVTIGYARLKETLIVSSSAKFSPIPMLKSTTKLDKTAFRSNIYKEKIKTITFEDQINVPETAIESWDVSESQNGAYMAYVVPNEADSTYYDLYIQGDGKIYANENMSYWFNGLTYVDAINGLELLETENVTSMKCMFSSTGYNSTNFTLDVSGFDTSNVTDMGSMFSNTGYKSTIFTLDVSNFDTSNVTNMGSMFYYTGYSNPNFTLDVSNFDTGNVTNMGSMFDNTGYNSTSFVLDVSGFDTSNVTNMSCMFSSTGKNSTLFTLDVSNFDTSNVTDMTRMFYNTGYSNQRFTLDVSNFDTSKVTVMHQMFDSTGYSNPNFILDVSGFDTSKVTDMSGMFYQAGYNSANFTIDTSNFDTSSATDMSSMFNATGYNSTKLNTSITIKNPNTTSYTSMFNGVATKEGSQITVNYTSETSDLVDAMIATKSELSNVVKGVQVD